MITRTKGIVLKRIPYTDNSAVVHIYTGEHGLVPFLVQGLGKAKSKIAYYQIGQLLDINYNHKPQGGLHRVKEVSVCHGYSLPLDFIKQQLLFFYVEVIQLSLTEAHQDKELFTYVEGCLSELNDTTSLRWAPIIFLTGLAHKLGYAINPDLVFPHDEELRMYMDQLHAGVHPNCSKTTRKLIMNQLLHLLREDVLGGKTIKSLEVLEELND